MSKTFEKLLFQITTQFLLSDSNRKLVDLHTEPTIANLRFSHILFYDLWYVGDAFVCITDETILNLQNTCHTLLKM